jgi:predicted esterase
MSGVVHHTFSARLDCHCWLRVPDALDSRNALVVTLHGFGSDPETMLHLTERLFDATPVIASIQAPNQFFIERRKEQRVGYGWITSRHAGESIRLHHDMVRHVLTETGSQFHIPPERRLLVGFSQAVALNYRLAASCPEVVRGVIGICGGLPGDWDTGDYQSMRAAVLHIARRDDQFYPPAAMQHYAERLRVRAGDVEFHLIDGGHSMPSGGNLLVEPWLRRILQSTPETPRV